MSLYLDMHLISSHILLVLNDTLGYVDEQSLSLQCFLITHPLAFLKEGSPHYEHISEYFSITIEYEHLCTTYVDYHESMKRSLALLLSKGIIQQKNWSYVITSLGKSLVPHLTELYFEGFRHSLKLFKEGHFIHNSTWIELEKISKLM